MAKSPAWINKTVAGNYRARHRLPDGSWRSQTFPSQAEAIQWRNAQAVAQVDGSYVDPRLGSQTFETWARGYLAGSVHLKHSSLQRDTTYLEHRIIPRFGDRQLGDITQPEVRHWVSAMTADGLAPATVVKHYQIFSKIMTGAVDAGLLARTPTRGIKLPRIVVEEMQIIDPDALHGLGDDIEPRWRALLYTAGYGGFRIGELTALRQKRVDFLRCRIEIAENAPQVNGALVWGTPKSKAGYRTVDMPRPVIEMLAAHIAEFGGGPDPEALVFGGERGGPLNPNRWRSKVWKPLVARHELDRLRFRDLRHTAVSMWIADGASPKLVAVRAGHGSVSVVFDRYGHLYPDAADELMIKQEQRFHNATPTAPKVAASQAT